MNIIVIIFIIFINVISSACGLTPLSVSQVVASATESAAQNLLDRVATKVATLAEKLKKGVAGEISAIGNKTLSLGDQKIIISEATTYYRIKAGNKTTIEFKNLAKGDDIAVIGTADTTTGDITARQIIAKVQRLVLTGKVTNIDQKKNIYTLTDKDAEIDAVTVVKKSSASGFLKAKYSDISVGDNLVVFGYYNKPQTSLTSLKTLILTN